MKLLVIFVALAISSFGQLINVIPQAVIPNPVFNNTVIQNIGNYPVFNYNSQTYINIGALPFDYFKVGINSFGEYQMTVSYLGEYSDGENIISIGNGTNNIIYQNLYSSYEANNFSYSIKNGSGLIDIAFANTLLGYNITSWQNNNLHFNWYFASDNTYIGFIDDIGTTLVDYNDASIHVKMNFIPFNDAPPPTAIPESSTYTLFSGILILSIVFYRRFIK